MIVDRWFWEWAECTCGRGASATVHDHRCKLWVVLNWHRLGR